MKMRSGLTCVISAVAAVSFVGLAHGQNLRWDIDGPGGINGADGPGAWELSNPIWYDINGAANTAWVQGANAIFGDPANTVAGAATPVAQAINLSADIVVGDISFNRTADGNFYTLVGDGGGSLTLNGNFYYNSGIAPGNTAGQSRLDLFTNPFTLGTGQHVFALRDTPGDFIELAINSNVGGTGGLTVDNRLVGAGATEAFGSLALNGVNNYDGTTNVAWGRLVISSAGALGTAANGTTISEAGTLSIGANGVTATNVTLSEPILITRNTYNTGEFGRYNGAIITGNGTGTTTINGPFVIDSTEARVRAQSSTLEITSNITTGANASSVLAIDGDTAGFVHLTGNNTALALGGIRLVGGELNVDNDNQIGGANAPINFAGGYIRFVGGYLSNFGTHVINGGPDINGNLLNVNGGVDLDAGTTFTVTQNLTGNSFAERGTGTLNLNGTNVLTGANFYDGGIININGNHKVGGLRLRRATVNVNSGAVLTTMNTFSSIGIDNTEDATLNILSGGQLVASNNDFNVADNAGSKGKLTIQGTGTASIAGFLEIGKNANTVGIVSMDGASLSVGGETWVGNGPTTASGTFTQTTGATTVNSWLAIGRQNAKGTFDISGGTFTRQNNGGNHNYVGEGSGQESTATVRGTALVTFNAGQFWVANGGSSKATLTVADSASFTVNSWIAVGRNGTSNGTLNIGGTASVTKGGDLTSAFTIGSGGTATGLVTQTGGTVTSNRTFIGENGKGTYNMSAGTASLGALTISDNGAGIGVFDISGPSTVIAGDVTLGRVGTGPSTLNIGGTSFAATSLVAGTSTGAKTFNWTAGRLGLTTYSLASNLNNTGTTTVLAPRGLGDAATTVGALTMTSGSYTQGATGQLAIELASAASNDSLLLTGAGTTATLGGPINFSLLGGYVPSLYTPVTILSAPTVTGIFSSVGGIVASPTRSLAVTYDGTSVKVQAAEPGDANLDGIVGFPDLVLLAQNYNMSGRTWVQGDFSGDGTVNFPDLVSLAQFYNQPASFTADWALAQSLAPEPTSLMVLGLAGLLGARRRSR